jgi:stress-induced morphogen
MATPPSAAAGPVQQAIERKVTEALQPTAFKIVNDSHKHAGHAGNPSGAADAETHFTCTIESGAFDGKSRIQQHRMVYELLGDEFAQGLHALALKTSAPK